jgi:hypothetical protein
MQKQILSLSLFIFFSATTFAQKDSVSERKFSVSTSVSMFTNIGSDKATNTHHYELHFKYDLTPKNKIGLKFATWSLFQPMGIQYWDGLMNMINKDHELYGSEFYPGRVEECGIGVSYQRMLWKGLFATVEVLPQYKRYVDENKKEIGTGFKLYTSYHIGYHISFFKNRFFVEPQIHCQNWLIDTNTPQEFKEIDKKWKNYFLFEPNLYFGFKF